MKALIVTVAGSATRFNKDTEEETLKCIYNIGGYKNTLLYQILNKARDYDEFIIVGGFLYSTLKLFIDQELTEFKDKIKLVYNSEYTKFGSGFSLYLGMEHTSLETEEIIFVEGDLYFNNYDFDRIKNSKLNAITINHEPITAKKAVVVYVDGNNRIRYLYDTSHSHLEINEPFLAIYNSGQVWKFANMDKLRIVLDRLTPHQIEGTNLEIIQGYFGDLNPSEYEIIEFATWHNCNTVSDYRIVHSIITK